MDSATEKQSKETNCKLEDDQPRNGLESLPSDIALDILSRLPAWSLLPSRFVCRAWSILSHDPRLVKLYLSRTTKINPCLIFHCDNPIKNQLCFLDLSDHSKTEKVRKIHTPFCSAMPEFEVVGSCNGLLCLSDSDAVYVFNPFTSAYEELPRTVQFPDQKVVFGFGFHPTTNEYKVIKVVYHSRPYPGVVFRCGPGPSYSESEVQIFSLGSTNWRNIGKMPYQLEERSSRALVNGRLHWLSGQHFYSGGMRHVIVSFDLANERFSEVRRPDFGGGGYRGDYHLAALGGCLSAAAFGGKNEKMDIWVMKEYGVKESWIKEYSIRAYSGIGWNADVCRSPGVWVNAPVGRLVRVLCLLSNGEVLMEYKGRALFSYDPVKGEFKDLTVEGMENCSAAVVHVGSLNWINIPIDLQH